MFYQNDKKQFIQIGELGGEINIDVIYSNLPERNERKAHFITSNMFILLVKNKGAWDSKQNKKTIWGHKGANSTVFRFHGEKMSPQDVGNHHFGVVLKGNGSFSERTGLIGAGIAQLLGGHSNPIWLENTHLELYYFNSNIGITPVVTINWGEPYGDDPEDQKWIKQGYDYWERYFKK